LLAPRPTPTLEDLYPPETGLLSYTPRHRVPILVAYYDTHGLRWDYSYSPVTTRECADIRLLNYLRILQIRKLVVLCFTELGESFPGTIDYNLR
jgi:hypothetical protein